MKRIATFGMVIGTVLLLFSLPSVLSTPTISLRTHQQWSAAWNAGQIQPVTAWDNGLESHYPGMSGQLRIPNLAVMDSIPEVPDEAGLVMAWGSPADDGQEIIAAWQYDFGLDPDLTGHIIHLCVFPPCHINTISFGLKDINGKIKSWDWSVGFGGVVPCDTQVCFVINPALGAGQAGATSYYVDPGFDLTKVALLIFDENGVWVDSLPPDPAGFGQNAWNYWKDIYIEHTVSTEQSTWGRIKDLYKGDSDQE